jgi:hypothetical protein
MRIFKYGKKEHLIGLLSMGRLRIGTLSDYRQGEHAKGVSDATEGTKTVVNELENSHFHKKGWGDHEINSAKMLADFGVFVGHGADKVSIHGLTILKGLEVDAFAFCFAFEEYPSLKTMNQFEGADACLEIVEPVEFFNEVHAFFTQVSGAHRVISAQPVAYKERSEIYNGKDFGLHPGLIKELCFRPQNEGRILWEYESANQSYQPFISGHWRLGSYCKLVSF